MQLPPFSLVDWFAEAEGKFDLSLSHSDCEPLTISQFLNEEEFNSLADFSLKYGEFSGSKDLKEIVSQQYSTMSSADILIVSGASEAIYTFMRTSLQPGDEVIVQSPCFNSLKALAEAFGCQVVEWRPRSENNFDFEVSTLKSLCSGDTKLIVINFPHNPTGKMISHADLETIVEVAKKSNAFLFSDETFRQLELPDTPRLPAACDLYEKAVSVTGVSKTHGLGGLRIGWLASKCRESIQRAKEYRYYTTEMTNTPCQYLATQAMRRTNEIVKRNQNRIAEHVESLRSFCNEYQEFLTLYPPDAGPMALVEQHTSFSSSDFCNQLLEAQRVFLVPGETLGITDRLLRFGFGREDFHQGLDRLGEFLESSR